MLPVGDQKHLRKRGLAHEALVSDGMLCVVIPNDPLPPGLSGVPIDLLLRLPGTWPDGQPDMFWVSPAIQIGGRYPAAADYFEMYLGRQWQRWSRHLNGGWNAGDDLSTWLRIVDRELAKAVA
jgi:hypothetical protein